MAETPLESVTNRVFTLIQISVTWKLGAVRVGICLLYVSILGNYGISMNLRAIRVFSHAALVTQNTEALRNTVVPSNNLYCCVVIT